MSFIYDAMDRAKETIQRAFNDNKEKYKNIFAIIHHRWDCQLYHPLHMTGYYLNPRFYYTNSNIDKDVEMEDGLNKCIVKLSEDDEFEVAVHKELLIYKRGGYRFGMTTAIKARTLSPGKWESSLINLNHYLISDSCKY